MQQTSQIVLIQFILAGLLFSGETKEEEAPYNYEKAAKFWSFQKPQRHEVSGLKNPDWVSKPADAFVLKKLEEANLEPNAKADDRALKRRIAYALTGLPPNYEEAAEKEYEEYVEQLLESPHFGERWARLWLDVARYAEDQAHIVGNNTSLTYPNAWAFREWVIQALNEDMPYDEFLKRQLAADLMFPEDNDAHQALGFMGLGPKYYRRGDLAVMADEWEDRIDTLSRGVLGLTVACSRCHDHFFDPIPTSDYYALAGVFASTEMFNRPMKQMVESEEKEEKKDKKKKDPKSPQNTFHLIKEAKNMKNVPVYLRGDVQKPGEAVNRGFLTILGQGGKRQEFDQKTSGRLELADALVDRSNPLTARVWVNRVWAEMFGQPLVSTTSNFGSLGDKPTHPQLLDDLAVRFMEDGKWSLKWLVREIALSSTYQQSAEAHPDKMKKDADNRLLWRMQRRRLSMEMLRDSLFTVAGNLDTTIGGKSFDTKDPKANRRAIYARVSRLQLDPMLALFDFPDPNLHSAGRNETTTPLQKLFLINNPLVIQQSKLLAERISKEVPDGDQHDQVKQAYSILFGRQPVAEELKIGLQYLQIKDLNDYTQALLCTNEFSWLD